MTHHLLCFILRKASKAMSFNTETKHHLGSTSDLAPFTQIGPIPLRVGFSWMTPFTGTKFDGVQYAI